MEYSDWIENYRKWRQWNKKGTEEEDNLYSPYSSPLYSVVSFAKCSSIDNPTELRKQMQDQ